MSKNSPHKEDIRDQLSDIQRKLFGSNKPRKRVLELLARSPDASLLLLGEIHGSTADSTLTSSKSVVFPPVPTLYAEMSPHTANSVVANVLQTLPVASGPPPSSSAMLRRSNTPGNTRNNVCSRSLRLFPQPNPQLRPESRGQDMNFVVGLSENLLGECRRLTAENHDLKARLKTQGGELSEYKTQVSALATTKLVAASSEIGLRDKNWELETNVAELSEQVDALKSANEKLVRTHNGNTLRIANLQRDNDEHQMRLATLQTDLRMVQDAMQKRLLEMNTRVDELSDENDYLHAKIGELEAPDETEPVQNVLVTVPAAENGADDAETWGNIDLNSVLQESAAFLKEPAVNDPQCSDLQVETLRANLAYSARTVSRLRLALLKLNNGPFLPSAKTTPTSAKKTRNKELGPQLIYYTPAKGNSKFIILNENDDEKSPSGGSPWPQEDNWETYIGADPVIGGTATLSKPSQRVIGESDEDLAENVAEHIEIGSELKRTSSYLNDTDSSELDFEVPRRPLKARVLSQELSRAADPVTEVQVQEYARDHNLVLLPLADYARLEHNDVCGMSADRITAVAESKGFVLMTKSEHRQFLADDEMEKRLRAKGIVTIPQESLKELHDELHSVKYSLDSPDLVFLSEKLRLKGYEPVEKEYFESLRKSDAMVLKPSHAFLVSRCKTVNLSPVPMDELRRLKEVETEYEQPSKEYLTERANEMGLFVAATGVFEDLEGKAYLPSVAHVTEKARGLGLEVLSAEDFSKLENPLLDSLKTSAKAHGRVILSEKELADLQELAQNPPLAHLKSVLKKYGHVTLCNEEVQHLKEPDMGVLTSRAAVLGFKVVPESELTDLHALAYTPSIDHLKQTAKALGFTVTSVQDYKTLVKLAHDPGLSHIQKHAEKHDLVTLSGPEYTSLYKQATEPSLEDLAAKAAEKSRVVVKVPEYNTMKQVCDVPSMEFLRSKAENVGHVLVPYEELLELKGLAYKPSEKHLRECAKSDYNMEVLPMDELGELKRLASAPDQQHLTEKTSRLGFSVLPEEDVKILRKRSENPLIEEIEEFARKRGYVTLVESEFAEIQRLSAEPSVQELSDRAERHGMVVVDGEEYGKLLKPTVAYMQDKCQVLGFAMIALEELSELKLLALEPSFDQLRKKAGVLTAKIVTNTDFDALHTLAHNPPLEHLTQLSAKVHHVLVPEEKFLAMQEKADTPNLGHISEKAQSLDMVVISKNTYECPSLEFLRDKAQAQGHVLVKTSEFEKPSFGYLAEKVALYGKDTVDSSELKQLRLQLTPSENYVQAKAKLLGFVLLSQAEFMELQALAHHPSELHITKMASMLELAVLPQSELTTLKNDTESPPKDLVVSRASPLGLTTVPNDSLKELKKKVEKPTFDELSAYAASAGYTLVRQEELHVMVATVDKPPRDFLEEKARDLGLLVVVQLEYTDLQAKAHKPTLSQLKDAASEKDLVVISKAKYAEAVRLAFDPSRDHLLKLAAKFDSLEMEREDFEHLKRTANEPTLDHIQSCASVHQHVLVAEKEYESLQNLAHRPPIERLLKMAEDSGHVVVLKEDFEHVTEISRDTTVERACALAANIASVVVASDAYNDILKKANSPTSAQIEEAAAGNYHVITPKAEFSDLNNRAMEPTLSQIEALASGSGRMFVSMQDNDSLQKPVLPRLSELASARDHTLLPLSELQFLKNLEEDPDLETIKERASKLGTVVVSDAEHEELEKLARTPSEGYVTKTAGLLGLAVILDHKLQMLQNPGIDAIIAHADRLGHDVLAKNEHLKLKKALENPSMQVLTKHVTAHGYLAVPSLDFQKHLEDKQCIANMKLITTEEYDSLSAISQLPSVGFLQEKAQDKAYILVGHEKYEGLLDSLENPTHEYLVQKAKKTGFEVVESGEFEALQETVKHPSTEFLLEQAASKELVLMPEAELALLNRQIEQPLLDYLKEQAQGHETMPGFELEALRATSRDPLLTFLQEKLRAHSMEPVYCKVLSGLKETAGKFETPLVEHLQLHAKAHDREVVESQRFESVVGVESAHESPSEEYLHGAHNLSVVAESRLAGLEKCESFLGKPDLTYLAKYAEAHNHKLITCEDLLALQYPLLEFLAEHATLRNHKFLPKAEYEQILESIESPTIEYITEKAAVLGHVLFSIERAEAFENPSLEYLKEEASVQEYQLITNGEAFLLQSFQKIAENPLLDFLHEKAAVIGFVLLQKERASELEACEKLYQFPELEYLRVQAEEKGHKLVDADIYKGWSEKAAKTTLELVAEDGCTVVSKAEDEHRKSLETPLVDWLRERACAHTHVLIEQDLCDSLLAQIRDPTMESLRENAEKSDHVISSASEFLELSESLPMKSRVLSYSEYEKLAADADESVEKKAENAGLVVLERPIFEALKQLEAFFEAPNMASLEPLALKLKCVVVPEEEFHTIQKKLEAYVQQRAIEMALVVLGLAEYEQLQLSAGESLGTKAAKEQKVVLDAKTYEESKGVEAMKTLAEVHGFKAVPEPELAHLKKEALKSLEARARDAQMVVLPIAEHQLLLNPPLEVLNEKATIFEKEMVDANELANLKREAATSIQEKAANSGLVLVPVAEFEELHTKANLPGISHLKGAALLLGYEVLKAEILADLNLRANKTLDDHVEGKDVRVLPNHEYDSLLLKANKPPMDHLSKHALSHGLVLVAQEEYEQMKKEVKEQFETKAKHQDFEIIEPKKLLNLLEQINSPTKDFLLEKAKEMDLAVVPVLELEKLRVQSEKTLESYALEQNKVVLEPEVHARLLTQAYTLPIEGPELDSVIQELRIRGYMIVPKTEAEETELSATDEVVAWLKSRGFTVRTTQASASLSSSTPGTAGRAEDEFTDAEETFLLSADELQLSAARLGMVCVEQSAFQEMAELAEKSKIYGDKALIADAATALSLAVLPAAELTQLKLNLLEKESTVQPQSEVTKTSLMQNLRLFGMVVLEKTEYLELKSAAAEKDSVFSEEELRDRAEDLGLSVIPCSQYHEMKRAQATLKDHGLFVESARKFGLLCVPETVFVPTTLARTPALDKVTLIPTSYYEKLTRGEAMNIEKVGDEVFLRHAQKRGFAKTAPRTPVLNFLDSDDSATGNMHSPLQTQTYMQAHAHTHAGALSKPPAASSLPVSKLARSNLTGSSHQSVVESITGLSIVTNISFTDRSMIPAITQVVIGEYLFKYYRRLRPLSSISASRHERYFWVHPYSLTLYWSSSNPVLTNPSEVKTKAMAIESVESVDDNNPLPTGLHYKSIIVGCKLKLIKITCPTRQRHNTWYNALRYLVNRNIHELDLGNGGGSSRATSSTSDSHSLQRSHEGEDEDRFDPKIEFEPSTRHAFPRSSTILRSTTGRSLSTIRR